MSGYIDQPYGKEVQVATIITYAGILYPLTAAVFGPQGDRVLKGEVHVGVDPDDEPIGAVFRAEDDTLFTHPSLFESLVGKRRPFRHVRVTLEEGVLKARAFDPDAVSAESADPVGGNVTHEAAPVPAPEHVSLETVLYFLKVLERQKGACWMKGCPIRGIEHQLDRRNSVLVRDSLAAAHKVVCAECCDTRMGESAYARVHLDGRRIPFNTPVHITAST